MALEIPAVPASIPARAATKIDVGLGNVDNTSDANKPVSIAAQTALDTKRPLSVKVPLEDLAQDGASTGQVIKWDGAKWAPGTDVVGSGGGGGGAVDSVFGRIGVVVPQSGDYTFAQIGSKPTTLSGYGISDAAPSSHVGAGGTAHDTATTSQAGFMATNDKIKLDGVAIGATANSPDATLLNRGNHTGEQAQSTVTGLVSALAAKAPLANPTFTGTVAGITKSMVGLGNVDNTADASKPVSTAQAAAISTKNENIQFKDEGSNLGAAGTVNVVDIVGAGVTASRVGNVVTITIPNSADWDLITGNINDNEALLAALGGTDMGGPSDIAMGPYTGGRAEYYVVDGLTWVMAYHGDGRVNTATCGALVRTVSYDGSNRYLGVTGPKYQGGCLVLTYAQMLALSPSTSGLHVMLSDVYPGQVLIYNGARWRSQSGKFLLGLSGLSVILPHWSGATYTQSGNTVSVSIADHGLTADLHDGASIYLTGSSGLLTSGIFTGLVRTGTGTFTCQSSVSQTTSGNLGAQSGKIPLFTIPVKAGLMGPHGRIATKIGWSFRDTANNKLGFLDFGGVEFYNPTFNDKASNIVEVFIQNAGAANKQKAWVKSNDQQVGTSNDGGFNRYSVDTASDVNLVASGQVSTAGNFMVLECLDCELSH